MSTHDPGHRQTFYHAPCLGTVVGVYPIDPQDRRLYVDVLPHDMRGAMIKVPVFHVAGGARHLRQKMTVLLMFIDGNPQLPVVLGHHFNTEEPKTLHHNPLHPAHTQIDDHVTPHEETGAFFRMRSRKSSATQSAADGSPAVYDAVFNGGTALQVYEYDPTGYTPPPANEPNPSPPPKPDRAKVTMRMPSGLSLTIDEPSTGQVTVDIEHPSNASIRIGADGGISVTTPGAINVDAGQGSDGTIRLTADGAGHIAGVAELVALGAASGNLPLAFLRELQALVTSFNAHTHSGVQSGPGISGPPTAPAATPTGTQNVTAT